MARLERAPSGSEPEAPDDARPLVVRRSGTSLQRLGRAAHDSSSRWTSSLELPRWENLRPQGPKPWAGTSLAGRAFACAYATPAPAPAPAPTPTPTPAPALRSCVFDARVLHIALFAARIWSAVINSGDASTQHPTLSRKVYSGGQASRVKTTPLSWCLARAGRLWAFLARSLVAASTSCGRWAATARRRRSITVACFWPPSLSRSVMRRRARPHAQGIPAVSQHQGSDDPARLARPSSSPSH